MMSLRVGLEDTCLGNIEATNDRLMGPFSTLGTSTINLKDIEERLNHTITNNIELLEVIRTQNALIKSHCDASEQYKEQVEQERRENRRSAEEAKQAVFSLRQENVRLRNELIEQNARSKSDPVTTDEGTNYSENDAIVPRGILKQPVNRSQSSNPHRDSLDTTDSVVPLSAPPTTRPVYFTTLLQNHATEADRAVWPPKMNDLNQPHTLPHKSASEPTDLSHPHQTVGATGDHVRSDLSDDISVKQQNMTFMNEIKEKDKEIAELNKINEDLKETLKRQSEYKAEYIKKMDAEKLLSTENMAKSVQDAMDEYERRLKQSENEKNNKCVEYDRVLEQYTALQQESQEKLVQYQNATRIRVTALNEKIKKTEYTLKLTEDELEDTLKELKKKDFLRNRFEQELSAERDRAAFLRIQLKTYEEDFQEMRRAKDSLMSEKVDLEQQLNSMQIQQQQILDQCEQLNKAKLSEMQNRHRNVSHLPPEPRQPGWMPPYGHDPSQVAWNLLDEEVADFKCPKCFNDFPDMDSLNIHVQECVQ